MWDPFYSILVLIVVSYHFVRRKKIARFYKEIYFGLGSEAFWEKFIVVTTPFGIILGLAMLYHSF